MNKYTASRLDPLTLLTRSASVVATTMREALRWFESDLGLEGEPTQLYTAESNVLMASDAPRAVFSIIIDPTLYAEGARVYPEANSVYAGTDVLFTALVPTGRTFVQYQDALGSILAETAIATITLNEDVVITAVYA